MPAPPAGLENRQWSWVWATTVRNAEVPYFRTYDLRSTYATRLSARGVADEWVTQLLRQDDTKVFKKYSQMKLQMKREALAKLDRRANDKTGSGTGEAARRVFGTVLAQLEPNWRHLGREAGEKSLVFREVMEPPSGLEPETC